MPSPGTPIFELVAQNIQTTVAAITAGATYTNTIVACDRPNPGIATNMQDRRCVLAMTDANIITDPKPSQGHRDWILTFEILAQVVESESSSTAIDTRLASIAADIERALMVDIKRGANATFTDVIGYVFHDLEPNAHEGSVSVIVNVKTRTLWTNPYSQ